MDSIEIAVIGAGVIGLAVARELAQAGREVVILEAQAAFGTETSARNSEVIHAGIYYPHGSNKARWCAAGRELLYEFCARYGVPHRRCGKLIVATQPSQLAELEKMRVAAALNGVTVEFLTREQALVWEPQLNCQGALHSPATGIIDSHAYMLALLGQAQMGNAAIAYRTKVRGGAIRDTGVDLMFNDDDTSSVRARWVVNCAGLHATQVARSIVGFPLAHIPSAHYAKGNYFTLAGRAPFTRLIYPVPEPGGLGTHLTLDLAGQARFGPDVEWLTTMPPFDYAVDAMRGEKFYAAIRSYWPALRDGTLQPAYSGIRPKLSGPGEVAADFRIDTPAQHGAPGIINLFGIESPGLTSSLAIAQAVAAHVA
jgi:L-2-hydroxyglutarate oxidase LhgO